MDDLGDLARCDAEIAEIRTRSDVVSGLCPVYLFLRGIQDWEQERRAIEDPAWLEGVVAKLRARHAS